MCRNDTYGVVERFAKNNRSSSNVLAFLTMKRATMANMMFECMNIVSAEHLADGLKARLGALGKGEEQPQKEELCTANGFNKEVLSEMSASDVNDLIKAKCKQFGVAYPSPTNE